MENSITAKLDQATAGSYGSSTQPALKGNLNAFDIALATLAYCGPLSGVVGYVSLVIGMGTGVQTPLVFLALMCAMLIFSIGYCAMAKILPNPGAFYAYVTAGLGRSAGLGSALFTVAVYLAIACGFYAFAGVALGESLERIGLTGIPWWLLSISFWALVAILGYFHINISAKVLGVLLVLEVVAVAIFDLCVLFQQGIGGLSAEPFSLSSGLPSGLGIACLFGVGMFTGFEATAIYREEAKNPERSIPVATYSVVIFIGLMYAITTWLFICAMGVENAVASAQNDPAGIFLAVAQQFGGRLLTDVFSVLLISSIFAAHLSIQNVTTRYVYSLSRDGILPSFFARVHAFHESPYRASMAVSAITLFAILLFAGTQWSAVDVYSRFGGVAQLGIIAAMCVTSFAILAFFLRRRSEQNTGVGVIISSFAAFAILLTFVGLGVSNLPLLTGADFGTNLTFVGCFVAVWIIGFAYAKWLKGNRPDTFSNIGRMNG